MVELMLDFMLGPLRGLVSFYVDYQMIFNSLIVGFALYSVLAKPKMKKTSEGQERA
ncbi:hypothetical protein M3212_17175 [Alkalihalobacillus oceani]|uniref:hypothetical protein n=1 Tax=Halalkalibacter oceani TaxID=1653776 RepID=UPI00203D1894|nr:hypothetical protein [Halalkalibacter oceani]MCM3762504.1 hypothetical protein [Halalkalibacter oceani]